MDKLKLIVSRLGLFVFFKRLFGPFLKSRKLKAFNKNKNRILKDLSSISDAGGLFFLAFGTFLGAKRNGRIIPGDDDFDLGAFIADFDKLDKLFRSYGFKRKLMINTSEKHPVLAKYIKEKVIVDIFIHYPELGRTVCYDHVNINRNTGLLNEIRKTGHMVLYENSFTSFSLDRCELEGMSFLCPKEESYLLEAYGEDYMIPDGNWTYTDRSIRKESEVKGSLGNG
ncbi:LicD family protein [Spirochaeta isovalerica]|uniref:LicD/FKTN/FKRP nucleotidyltransferase domain-containing protein n=1 Tax=Spirochaeta isovalerica TaxID=150 RepID=A0A841RA32_9SPIO|nr:LicD family protein [Spirochaeta isovalerica]MBB6480753.1 hypothetical protein [Spirochaeta isovalerica]